MPVVEHPQAGLVVDSAGNLFGTTRVGGTNGDGTVFEWVPSSGTLSVLASFNWSNGAYPQALVEHCSSQPAGLLAAGVSRLRPPSRVCCEGNGASSRGLDRAGQKACARPFSHGRAEPGSLVRSKTYGDWPRLREVFVLYLNCEINAALRCDLWPFRPPEALICSVVAATLPLEVATCSQPESVTSG
jgi:uncharacterized repeat protein (TIGR03803 family)